MTGDPNQKSLMNATRSRAKFSGHGKAKGKAGMRARSTLSKSSDHLSEPGQAIAVSPGADGFKHIDIGVAWDNIVVEKAGFIGKLLGKVTNKGVDLDIGCLYELQDGTRGCVQAFGEKFGRYRRAPYIKLAGDERTGDKDGYDEKMRVNGAHWDEIKRILVYVYIYEGAVNWAQINPVIMVDVPGEDDLYVSLSAHNDALSLCAVGGLENVRGGIKLTNYTEYFPSHDAMDRAFGFGLEWGDGTGRKSPA